MCVCYFFYFAHRFNILQAEYSFRLARKNRGGLCLCYKIFFYLFVFVPLDHFSLISRSHHYRWRAANFFLSWHSLPMSNEGSLTCHSYCDTGHPVKMVISEDLRHLLLSPSFFRPRSVAVGIRTPNLPLEGRKLLPTAPPPLLWQDKNSQICVLSNHKTHTKELFNYTSKVVWCLQPHFSQKKLTLPFIFCWMD